MLACIAGGKTKIPWRLNTYITKSKIRKYKLSIFKFNPSIKWSDEHMSWNVTRMYFLLFPFLGSAVICEWRQLWKSFSSDKAVAGVSPIRIYIWLPHPSGQVHDLHDHHIHAVPVLGTALHIPTLPVKQNCGLQFISWKIPFQVCLVCKNYYRNTCSILQLTNQISKSWNFLKTVLLCHIKHQKNSICRC